MPLALLAATPAAAQSGASKCVPQSGSDEEFQQEIARSWLPFQIGMDVARASCRVNEFFDDLLKRKPDPDKITLQDVLESSKPDVGKRHDPTYDARRARMPSPTTRPDWNPNPSTSIVVLPPPTPGGTPVLFQPNEPGGAVPTSVGQVQGNGTLMSSEGMKRGTFVGGKLNGVGEEIDPNGTWRSGTYDRGTNTGQMFEVRMIDGKTYLVAGSVVNGKLDGMIERIFADGSTQFEDWENGQLMQVGNRAPKGRYALAPQARYKPPVQVATTDAYKHTLQPTKIAPGTAFNPAKTVGSRNHPTSPTSMLDEIIWPACSIQADNFSRSINSSLENLFKVMLNNDPTKASNFDLDVQLRYENSRLETNTPGVDFTSVHLEAQLYICIYNKMKSMGIRSWN